MPVQSIVNAASCPAEQRLLTIGAAGVLSSRAIAVAELETLLFLLGPPSERKRSDLKRATDIVLVEEGKLIYWPRTGEHAPRGGGYHLSDFRPLARRRGKRNGDPTPAWDRHISFKAKSVRAGHHQE
jgi:hypothetical protein